jgi:hypothetical protein
MRELFLGMSPPGKTPSGLAGGNVNSSGFDGRMSVWFATPTVLPAQRSVKSQALPRRFHLGLTDLRSEERRRWPLPQRLPFQANKQ